jgi:transglutaminase-like putative cysteine protease
MTFQSLYRISMYVMLFLATLCVSLDASADNPLAILYPPAVVLVGVIAFLTVDRRPTLGLTREVAHLLAFISIGLAYIEYWHDETLMIMAFGHFFVYLQLIKMLSPKTVEDDWYLVGLGLIQVLIGAFLARGDRIGLVLVAWAITTLWTMGLFYLRRRADQQIAAGDRSILPAIDPLDPYPSLVDLPFLSATAKVAMTTLVLGGLIFLVLPRWTSARGNPRSIGTARHLTGFSDDVKLGQIGEILESEEVVLSVELYDEDDRRIKSAPEQLWRGVALTDYRDGRWSRSEPHDVSLPSTAGAGVRHDWPSKRIWQHIKLEPSDNSVLFAIRPMLAVSGRGISMNQWDGMLYRTNYNPSASAEYDVISANDGSLIQPLEAELTPIELKRSLVEVSEPLKARLASIVEPLVADIPRDRFQERADRLLRHLRDSGQFSYTLQMRVVDPALDPVEDFLIHRKAGHCEYFASGLTLMLRSIGIPARMVNGFKGGDWNELARVTTVRQKHAHSWVEVLIDGGPHGAPIWMTFDPTPAQERDESVAKVGGYGAFFLPFSDFVRYVWVFYVAGFNAERQQRVIYGPIAAFWREGMLIVMLLWESLKAGILWLVQFRTAREFFSVRGFFASVIGLLALSGLVWIGVKIVARIRRRFGTDSGQDFDPLGMPEYRRLTEILAGDGLRRPSAETAREFALRAAETLRHRGEAIADVADVPPQVIDVFYRLRFGGMPPADETLAFLSGRLDALEALLRPVKGSPFGGSPDAV